MPRVSSQGTADGCHVLPSPAEGSDHSVHALLARPAGLVTIWTFLEE